MTRRMYYDDSYATRFSAVVVERLAVDGRPAVILDQTYFYPASGGQPADTGWINNVPVLDVFAREGDAAVVHVLANDMPEDAAACRIDWERRFDHMQHHTGQHILTQAFVQVAGANTVGFHLSPDSVTIDLDKINISAEAVEQVEELANRVVWENRPVTARLVKADETDRIRMRKMPGHLLTDGLRVIEVADFDLTACGGTHVACTGEIGIIKVLKLERRGDKTRVEFRCGGRALRDYRQKNAAVGAAVAALTCGVEEIEGAILALQEDVRGLTRSLKAAGGQLIAYEAERLLGETVETNGIRIVKRNFERREPLELKHLAMQLVEAPGVIALLGTSGEKAHLVFARSADLPHDMNALIRQAFAQLGAGRGGGQPALAQGGGVPADSTQIQAALSAVEQSILNS
ncbi:alanyl-tRNA editing protein [Anaerolineae bacterium CFX8]|nr:alanyl-tRNA editing protein [Anaerolineae bacterium CFX8]